MYLIICGMTLVQVVDVASNELFTSLMLNLLSLSFHF